jgi:hypothetical protein
MIIHGNQSILDRPETPMSFYGLNRKYTKTPMSLYGLDRPPAEIALELNTNWKTSNPDLVNLFNQSGISTNIFAPTDQYVIDQSNQENAQELLAAQAIEIEKNLQVQRQLNAELSNAKTIEEGAQIVSKINDLVDNSIQPKLISMTQNTINFVQSNQGALSNDQVENLTFTLADNTNKVLDYQNATKDYTAATLTYLTSDKTENDLVRLSQVVNEVNNTFDAWAAAADNVQVSIADASKTAADLAAKLNAAQTIHVDAVTKTSDVAKSIIDETVFTTEPEFRTKPTEQSNVLPLLIGAAALYFGMGA